MEVSLLNITIGFPYTGETERYVIDTSYTYTDVCDMIKMEFGLDSFQIISNEQEINWNNFVLYDNIRFNVVPKVKTSRIIKKNVPENQIKYIPIIKLRCNHSKDIPNIQKEQYISPDYIEIKIRNYDRDELENIGKKYKIAIEEEYNSILQRKKENERSHSKLIEIREKIRKTKEKRNVRLGISKPKKESVDTFCGFKKGFLL